MTADAPNHLVEDLYRLASAWPGLIALARHPGTGHAATTVYGSPANANLAALDLVHHGDHEGHPGLVALVLTAEGALRAALGHSTPTTTGPARVPDALQYLVTHLDHYAADPAPSWPDTAAGWVWRLWDETLSRVDVDRVRLDYDLARRPASHAARQALRLIASPSTNDELRHHAALTLAVAAACLDEDYIDYEGRHYDGITDRYRAAWSDGTEFVEWLATELAVALRRARGLLGVGVHTTRPVTACPACTGPIGLAVDDPDTVECRDCGRRLRLRGGEADDAFAQARADGWQPERWDVA